MGKEKNIPLIIYSVNDGNELQFVEIKDGKLFYVYTKSETKKGMILSFANTEALYLMLQQQSALALNQSLNIESLGQANNQANIDDFVI